ncbi:MAG: hypothetical protein ACI92W_003172, partial [Paraglaciecola sp.]
ESAKKRKPFHFGEAFLFLAKVFISTLLYAGGEYWDALCLN